MIAIHMAAHLSVTADDCDPQRLEHCHALQVNPLAETKMGDLIAADAKLGFDDNAAFRQKEIFAMRDSSQEDPRSAARRGSGAHP